VSAPNRIALVSAGFGLAALAVVGRAAQLQLAQGEVWRARAAAQHTANVSLPARRGALFDRNGVALALTRETFGVGVAPRDLDDPARTAIMLIRALGLPAARVEDALHSGRVWVEWPGPFSWDAVAPLRPLRGVHLLRRLERFYPRADLAPRLIGRTDVRGRGASGLERALDSALAGRRGTAVVLKDHLGRTYPSPSRPAANPVDGADVVTTLDAELQEIADRALAAAVAEAGASGGNVVILQPATGDLLALASIGRSGGFVGDVFEPGSTAKIFTAAALLRVGRATPHDTVDAGGGTWRRGNRPFTDPHPARLVTLADVIRLSSNIGIVKLGERLSAVEQYEALRDFGFGSLTGIELSGESPGRLRHPRDWSGESAASLAMGYELAVTPLQLAAAYGVFANRGVLVEPTVVREVREPAPDGRVRRRAATRPVRRVVSAPVAERLAHMLRGVVEGGTGREAALSTYSVAGKTGTARRVVGRRYEAGHYTASFVGLFPAVDPQLVLVVKIDDPEGDYFGGSTAAPVVRTILEAALATPAVTLDRSRLTRRRAAGAPLAAGAAAPVPPVLVAWPLAADSAPAGARAPVPDVAGLDLRAAARALHRAGFRVRVNGWGTVAGTSPAAGAEAEPGALVTVRAERPGAR